MANFYGYANTGSNQPYGVTNPGNYGGAAFSVQPSQQGPFIGGATHQVQQPQAYVTYGPQGGSVSSQSYQGSYNNYGSSTQQGNFNKGVSQTYYQQAGGSNNTSQGPNQPGFYSNNQAGGQRSQQQVYAGGGVSANFNQQQVATAVAIPATTQIQGNNSINNFPSKQVTATVISSAPSKTGTQQQNVSNYEKALLSAATSIYNQHHKGGGGPSNFQSKNMPYWKQKRMQQVKDPNKPIVASEVKAYLYAWLGKERTRPEYNIMAHGNSPYRQTYVCEMVAPGFSYVGKGSASNKKDAQTRAAWDFCDYLVREKKMTEEELPTRENKFKAANNKLPSTYKEHDNKQVSEAIAKKKLETKKINFVGGSTLHLSDTSKKEADTTPVVYPIVGVGNQNSAASNKASNGNPAEPPTKVVQVKREYSAGVPPVQAPALSEDATSKNGPVGESYVEQVWTDGRVIRYRCSLCECEFNDPSARDLHVRGRRHRLSYKKKVDPSIEVDVKLNPKQKSLMMLKMRQEARKEAIRQKQKERQILKAEMQKQEELEIKLYEEELYYQYQRDLVEYEEEMEFHRRRNLPPPTHLLPPRKPILRYFQPRAQVRTQQMKTLDDQHVLAKHAQIYPTEEELNCVQKAVQLVEGVLKEVSNAIHQQEMKVYTASLSNNLKKPQPERLLKAVLRIGALAKGLLLRGDLYVQLVLMCNEKPTVGMLTRVADNLPKQLGTCDDLKFTMKLNVLDCSINLITSSEPQVKIQVVLTSTLMRPPEEIGASASTTKGGQKPDPPDILDRQKCCLALAALRHSKWFQAKSNGLQSCVIVTRIMKDLCVRVPTWTPLSNWAVELIVERVVSSAKLPLSPSGALQRVFEAIASGVLLPGGPGLIDPCERSPVDAATSLTSQEREDITASAQHALRLLAFRNIHKVLGIDQILSMQSGIVKKRPGENLESVKQDTDGEMLGKRIKVEEM
ncbi:zinc finger RNA-binding protein-like isoform X3 [Clavelina lepadiformis]|uniref:zinc finger RNA-binding protein-like isoform X3 n=1 Tax=Clavelina lepadiformis TaxID=159417 RepID=UPI0040429A59